MKEFAETPQYINVSNISLEKVNPECGYWVRAEDFEELLEAYNELKFRMEGLEK